jgi:precorrin-2 dehydrogenase / sirohydrochlorin ferrochelatase
VIPIYLDPHQVRIALVGRGPLCVRRLNWLVGLGATPIVYSDAPSEELCALAGAALIACLPGEEDLARVNVIWVADLDPPAAEALADAARAKGVLVNVEDVKPYCDFHTPAIVKRGRLVLAAGTGGASPAAASAVRERLEAAFGEDWAEALDELAEARAALRETGAVLPDITADARARLRRRALIP